MTNDPLPMAITSFHPTHNGTRWRDMVMRQVQKSQIKIVLLATIIVA